MGRQDGDVHAEGVRNPSYIDMQYFEEFRGVFAYAASSSTYLASADQETLFHPTSRWGERESFRTRRPGSQSQSGWDCNKAAVHRETDQHSLHCGYLRPLHPSGG